MTAVGPWGSAGNFELGAGAAPSVGRAAMLSLCAVNCKSCLGLSQMKLGWEMAANGSFLQPPDLFWEMAQGEGEQSLTCPLPLCSALQSTGGDGLAKESSALSHCNYGLLLGPQCRR